MRRTAITCPAHAGCVALFLTVPEGELGDLKALKLPNEYHSWLSRLGEVCVGVQHVDSTPAPDLALVADVGFTQSRKIQNLTERLDDLEGFVTRKRRNRRAWRKAHG